MIQRNPNRRKMNYNKDVTQNKKISDKFGSFIEED